ncbi:MAG: hypothetical protein WD000_03210 [Thermodesulfobacteriota bacterium]
MNKHLDFDTDFLNNPTSGESRPSAPKNTPPPEGGGSKKGWIIAAIVIGVLIVIGSMEGSGSSSSTYTNTTNTRPSTPTQNQEMESFTYNGQTYSCSSYHHRKAGELEPPPQSAAMISESAALDARIRSLALESTRVDNMYVDEYSQYSIDNYNAAVNAYNAKNSILQADLERWNAKTAVYDRQVDIYNNYLTTNCSKQ